MSIFAPGKTARRNTRVSRRPALRPQIPKNALRPPPEEGEPGAHSSVGQSSGLIIRRSWDHAPLGPHNEKVPMRSELFRFCPPPQAPASRDAAAGDRPRTVACRRQESRHLPLSPCRRQRPARLTFPLAAHRRKCGMCRPGLDIAPVFLLTRRTSHIGLALFWRLRFFYCSFGQLCCSAQCSSSSGSVSCTSVRRSSTARRSPSTCCTAPPLRRTPCHQPLRDGAHQPHFRPEPPARRRIPTDTRHLRRMHRRRQPPPPPMAAPRPPGPAAPTTMKTHELHLLHPTIRFAGPKPGAACRHPAGTCGPNRTQQDPTDDRNQRNPREATKH